MAIDFNEVFDIIRRIKSCNRTWLGLSNSCKEGSLVLHVYVKTCLYYVLQEPYVWEIVVNGNTEACIVGEVGYHEEYNI